MPRQRYTAMLDAVGLCLRARITPLLWAGPGVGKTSVVESLTGQGYLVETVICSHYEPVDFAGLPVVSGERGPDQRPEVTLAPPDWAVRAAGFDGPAVVFLDELSTATPATQAAALRPLTHHEVGSLRLPESVAFIAAANPTDLAAGGFDLRAATANRLCHIDWVLPLEVFVELTTTGSWPELRAPEPVGEVRSALADSRALIASFVSARPNLIHAVPTDALTQGGAFPTPRTWEYAARLLGWGRACGASQQAIEFAITGVVGRAASHELLAFIRHHDLPDPEALLAEPTYFDFSEARPDQINVILNAVVARVASHSTDQRWQSAVEICARAAEQRSLEAAVPAARALLRPGVRPPGAAVPSSIRVFAAPLALAGLLPTPAA